MAEFKFFTGNIGLCGAHRTGKTTLAIALSQRLNIPFVDIGTSAIFAEQGLNLALPMDIRTRLEIQRKILDHAVDIWFEMDQPFICDRTPIDMMAYTLAEVQGNTLDKDLEWELGNYLLLCKRVTKRYFGNLILVPPAIPLVDTIGKASLSKSYIDHVHYLCLGLFHESPVNGYMIERSVKELSARVADVVRYLNI